MGKVTKTPFRTKAAGAVIGIRNVLRIPRYAVFSLLVALLFAHLIFFSINIGFYWAFMTSRLPLYDKLVVLTDMGQEMLKQGFTTRLGALLIIVSVMQGIAVAIIVYSIRRNRRFDTKMAGAGGLALFAAALGLGCVPCGTSLLIPLLTLLFSSSAYAVASTASTLVLVVALALSIYSLYRLGYVAYMHHSLEEQDGEAE